MSSRSLHLVEGAPQSESLTSEPADSADEGYVEPRFETPSFMEGWTDRQKADFAFQLLSNIKRDEAKPVVDRLTKIFRRDMLSPLPSEIALHILSFLDANTLTKVIAVSRRWKRLAEDQTLWRQLFIDQGWQYDQMAMHMYLSNQSSTGLRVPRRKLPANSRVDDGFSDDIDSSIQPFLEPIPLARSTASIYDPATSSTAVPSPSTSSSRLRPFRRPGDLFLRLRQSSRQETGQPSVSSSSTSSSSTALDDFNDHLVEPLSHDLLADSSSSQQHSTSLSTSNVSRKLTTLPPIPFPLPLSLAAPTAASRSQPLLLSQRPPAHLQPSFPIRSSVSTTSRPISISSSDPFTISNVVVERPFKNRPMPRRNVKYDETAIYHYDETTDTRFINWKRLYRNRHLIEKRWREGKCKMRTFPPSNNMSGDMHLEGIYCIQFDENKVISGSRDRSIKIWDMRTGECRRTLMGHTASVLCLQYDDRFIISGSSDATIIQWDIETGKIMRTLYGHSESVLNLRFSGNYIVSCSKDRTVRIWDVEKGVTLRVLRGHRAAVNAVQFKDNRVVSASGDRTIKLWDIETGACLRTFDSHSRGIACVEFDGVRIVSGSSDQTIKIWDVETGECLHTLAGHTDLVRTLQLDARADRIISGSYDGSLKIWSLSQGRLLRNLSRAVEGRVLNLQFDYARIVCCSNLAKIVKYDFAHGIDTQFLM